MKLIDQELKISHLRVELKLSSILSSHFKPSLVVCLLPGRDEISHTAHVSQISSDPTDWSGSKVHLTGFFSLSVRSEPSVTGRSANTEQRTTESCGQSAQYWDGVRLQRRLYCILLLRAYCTVLYIVLYCTTPQWMSHWISHHLMLQPDNWPD